MFFDRVVREEVILFQWRFLDQEQVGKDDLQSENKKKIFGHLKNEEESRLSTNP